MKQSAGFTLIEMLITVAIIALIATTVVVSTEAIFDTEIRDESSKLASTIQYLYGRAVLDGSTIRLSINIDEKKYWADGSTDPIFIEFQDEDDDANDDVEELDDELDDPDIIKPIVPSFSKITSDIIKSHTLPDSLHVRDIWVEHMRSAVEKGIVHIYFSPSGYVENSVINLEEDSGVVYSLKVMPLTGFVDIMDEYRGFDE